MAERSIKAGLESKTSDGLRIADRDVPEGHRRHRRCDTFTVHGDATADGTTAQVTVVQHDDKGDVTYSGDLSALVQR